MSEAARSSFNTQLASVMESLLAAAVCEISRIFEGSLSDSRAEVAQGREEVVLLKRKLEVLEVQLKDASATSGTVTFTQVLDGGPGVPLLLRDLHFEGDPSHGDGHGQASRVKEDMEVTEMESVTFSLDRAVVSMAIKEELLDQDPEPLSVELTCPVGTSPGATEPVELKEEGAVESTRPKLLQNPELLVDLLMARPEPIPGRPDFPSDGIGSLGPLRGSGGLDERGGMFGVKPGHASAAVAEGSSFPPMPEVVDDVTITALNYHHLGPIPRRRPEVTVPTGWPESEKMGPVLQFRARGGVAGALSRAPPVQGPSGEKPYHCPCCSKAFISPSHLNVHMRVHTGERPYCCSQCGKRFAHNGNLRAHQRQVHLGKRPYPCAECGKRFSKRGNLRTHLQQVHLGKRPYPCTHCRKAYFSLRDLRTHQMVHAAQ